MTAETTKPSDQLPPAFKAPRPLTKRGEANLRKRLSRWMHRSSWRLWEACDIVWNVYPATLIREFYFFPSVQSDILREEWAERAIVAGVLPVIERTSPLKQSPVRPVDFCRWVATQTHMIGEDRAAIFTEFAAAAPAPLSDADRRAVFDSGYSTPEFDAAIAAINRFWLDYEPGSDGPLSKVVIDWLETERRLDTTAATRVDRLIRHPKAKAGGRKAVIQKAT